MKESRVVIFIESSRWHLLALADLGSIVGSHLLTLISLREIQSTFPFSPTVIEAVIAGLAITVIYTARAAYLPGFPRLLFTRNRANYFSRRMIASLSFSFSFFTVDLFFLKTLEKIEQPLRIWFDQVRSFPSTRSWLLSKNCFSFLANEFWHSFTFRFHCEFFLHCCFRRKKFRN